MAITLEKVVEEIKSLTPHDRHRLREVLNTLPEGETTMTEMQHREKLLEKRLVDKGIVSHISPPITDLSPYQNRKLITIQGKPFSETIIEERR